MGEQAPQAILLVRRDPPRAPSETLHVLGHAGEQFLLDATAEGLQARSSGGSHRFLLPGARGYARRPLLVPDSVPSTWPSIGATLSTESASGSARRSSTVPEPSARSSSAIVRTGKAGSKPARWWSSASVAATPSMVCAWARA